MLTYQVSRTLKQRRKGWAFTGAIYEDGALVVKVKGNVADTTPSQIRRDIIQKMEAAVREYQEANVVPKELALPKDNVFVDKLKHAISISAGP